MYKLKSKTQIQLLITTFYVGPRLTRKEISVKCQKISDVAPAGEMQFETIYCDAIALQVSKCGATPDDYRGRLAGVSLPDYILEEFNSPPMFSIPNLQALERQYIKEQKGREDAILEKERQSKLEVEGDERAQAEAARKQAASEANMKEFKRKGEELRERASLLHLAPESIRAHGAVESTELSVKEKAMRCKTNNEYIQYYTQKILLLSEENIVLEREIIEFTK